MHEAELHERYNIAGGGFIAMEQCACGALRSITCRAGGTPIISDWELPTEEDEAEYFDAEEQELQSSPPRQGGPQQRNPQQEDSNECDRRGTK